MQTSRNPSINPGKALGKWWVVVLPEKPRLGLLVEKDGRFVLVLEDGAEVPLELLGLSRVSSKVAEELPEPDYDAYYRWCIKSTSEETCRQYVSYLKGFKWPLRREDLYAMDLTSWHKKALRSYLNYLEEQGLDIEDWRKMRALKLGKSGQDMYIPSIEEIRKGLPRLSPRYRLVYYVILYTAWRPKHVLRLLREWDVCRVRVESIAGDCIRIALPPSWASSRKREFYAYMPRWLYTLMDTVVVGYRVPCRDSVTKHAKKHGMPAPKYARKFALFHLARLTAPDIAAHIGGHEPGMLLQLVAGTAKTETTVRHYVSISDLAKEVYHVYAIWLEENVAPRELLSAASLV